MAVKTALSLLSFNHRLHPKDGCAGGAATEESEQPQTPVEAPSRPMHQERPADGLTKQENCGGTPRMVSDRHLKASLLFWSYW